jgi:NADP-dependent 3-hydroxy acid dehydrogenase YdfG
MPAIAIVGAGSGLGLSIAKVFGRNDHDVALIARSQDHLDALVVQLGNFGVTAVGFMADVADPTSLTDALTEAGERFGRIDVLEFSPYAGLGQADPATLTVAQLEPHIHALLYGAITATQMVLPGMLKAGSGTLLFTSGGGSIEPYPMLAAVNIAQAATRNYVLNLNKALADKGIHVGHVCINAMIAEEAPSGQGSESIPWAHPDRIAALYWDMHTTRTNREVVFPA